MSFLPDPLVSEVITLLESIELAWIGEEIEEVINGGKPETFIVNQSRIEGKLTFKLGEKISSSDVRVSGEKTRMKLSPFTLDEQINIINKILETYTHDVSNNINGILKRANTIHLNESASDIELHLVDDESNEEFQLYTVDLGTIKKKLIVIQDLLLEMMSLPSKGILKDGD